MLFVVVTMAVMSLAPSKAWHLLHICIWQDSMVYPEQMNQPIWGVEKWNHWEAVDLAHDPQ